MNATQKQVLESLVRVCSFLDDAMRRAREHVATQESAPSLGRAKDEFLRPIVTIARAQLAPGADAGLPAMFRMPTGKLGLPGLLHSCDAMIESARKQEAVFVANGMPEDFLAQFMDVREQLARTMDTRATLTISQAVARKGRQVQLLRARLAVDRLDAITRVVPRGHGGARDVAGDKAGAPAHGWGGDAVAAASIS